MPYFRGPSEGGIKMSCITNAKTDKNQYKVMFILERKSDKQIIHKGPSFHHRRFVLHQFHGFWCISDTKESNKCLQRQLAIIEIMNNKMKKTLAKEKSEPI